MFYTVRVLRNFAKFIRKHQLWSLQVYSNFIQKDTLEQLLSCKFCIFDIVKEKIGHLNQNCKLLSENTSIKIHVYRVSAWFKSSRPDVFCKIGVLRNIAKLTGKQLCLSLFFSKFAGLQPATLLINKIQQRCFSVTFAKFFRTIASVI